jgi:sialate O-acetylesterase
MCVISKRYDDFMAHMITRAAALRKYTFVALLACAASPADAQPTPRAATLRLPRILGDGAVLQRDAPIHIWGWARPGASVNVRFALRTERVRADSSGAWRARFPSRAAGGPYALAVSSGADTVAVRDLLVGDVWLASGQSNMEWPVSRANDAAREIASANDAQLRHFKVPTSWSWRPENELTGGSWAVADAQHVADFSAVGYFFARELRKSTGVPIAILNASWSGSAIAPWMSRAALALGDSAWREIVEGESASQARIIDSLRARMGSFPTVDSGIVDGRAVWADPALDDARWAALRPGLWETLGYPGLDGVAWYRVDLTLSETEARDSLRLMLGPIDDDDETWVNGVSVGRTSGYDIPRRYAVPSSALRAGRNVIAIRVVDYGGGGGPWGAPDSIHAQTATGRRVFASPWRFKVAVARVGADGQHINKIPVVLYNQMIHPLLPFAIRGVIWYQGESNANSVEDARAYRDQFATLIRSWRSDLHGVQRDFPFLWAQLPNFGPVDTSPPRSATWAVMRESQSAALALPATGQAVTIDIGEAHELHPRNKQDVGRRLALLARSIAYGETVTARGPRYRGHVIRNGRAIVTFDDAAGGLVSRPAADTVAGFAIAGADGRFVWAHARILGSDVVVWSEEVPEPAGIRYAWGNSPPGASLYNRAGLPAVPFRTDRP